MKRRDVIANLLAAPALAMAGCRDRVAQHRSTGLPNFAGELLGQDFTSGHRIRGETLRGIDWSAAPTSELDVAIVGSGIAGLAATRRLIANNVRNVRLFELESSIGGTARGGLSTNGATRNTPYPWGAHYVPVPTQRSHPVAELLREVGVVTFENGTVVGNEEHLVRAPESRVWNGGYFEPGLFPLHGSGADDREQLARFEQTVRAWMTRTTEDQKPAFTLPLANSSADPTVRALDRVDARSWLRQNNFDSARLLWLLEYATRDDFGTTLAQTSAWAMLFYHAARTRADGEDSPFLTWPNGNAHIANFLRDACGDRVQTNALTVRVTQTETDVELLLLAGDRPLRVRAKHAVLAVPHHVRKHILVDARAFHGPTYGAWMVANLHLHRRPPSRGTPTFAWDNVLYPSPSLGYVSAAHQLGRDHGANIWTYYYALTDDDPKVARARLLEATHAEWCEVVVSDLLRAHPTLTHDIEKIDVFRWGHAMPQPRPNDIWHRDRIERGEKQGRIHFAHTDLSGLALLEEAYVHGERAAAEITERWHADAAR